ncbi:MAG: hypothetical protein JNM30_16100 [Rhodospirillales bacterium]|nr:hypothetical protein [Rhodospirillales bacterium]
MKARIAWGTMVLWSSLGMADAARAECNCLYNNQRYEQEDEVCMATPQGLRMARCGMLDNIAWWEMLDQPCPGQVSQLPPPARFPTPPAAAGERPDAASSR